MSKATAEQVPNGTHVFQRYYNTGQSLSQYAHDKLVYLTFLVPESNAGGITINDSVTVAAGGSYTSLNRQFVDRTIWKWKFVNSAQTENITIVAFVLEDRC